MGLIQVPRGTQTKRGYAPADYPLSALDSAAPWAWKGLLCYLPMIDGKGTARDWSPSRLPVSVGVQTPGWYFSEIGRVGRFNTTGAEQYVITDTEGIIRIPAPYSAVIWLNALSSEFWNVGGGGSSIPISNDRASDSSGWWFGRIGADTGNRLRFGTNSGNIQANVTNEDVDGVWTQVVLNQKTPSNAEVWINGRLNVSGDNGFDGPNNDSSIEIGNRPENDESYNGFIGPVMFYDRALSDEEIHHLYLDPYLPLRRRPLLIPVSSAAQGETATVSDSVHDQIVTSPVLTAGITLSPVSAVQGHAASTPDTQAGVTLSAQSTAHEQRVTSPSAQVAAILVAQDAAHEHRATSPTVQIGATLSAQDTAHDQIATSPDTVTDLSVDPSNSVHDQVSSQPTAQILATLQAEDTAHSQIVVGSDLQLHATVSPNDAQSSQIASQPDAITETLLSPQDAVHSSVVVSPSLLAILSLSPDNVVHVQAVTSPSANEEFEINPVFGEQRVTPTVEISVVALSVPSNLVALQSESKSVTLSDADSNQAAMQDESNTVTVTAPTNVVILG